MARYGYIYLDTIDPDISRQAMQLDSIGEYARIFIDRNKRDKGKHDEYRQQREKLLKGLQDGDVIYTAAIDRWCGNLREFIETMSLIEKSGADLFILAESLDTRSLSGRQAIKLLKRFERLEFCYQSDRKKAGIEAARRNGRRIGRPQVAIPPGFRQICREWQEGRISGTEAAKKCEFGSTSFYKKAAELGYKSAKRRKK